MPYISTTIQMMDKKTGKWVSYDISMDGRDTLWITNSDGEGGQFSAEKFFKVVQKFFKDNL